MDIIIMNSKNNKTSDPHRLMLNFTNKKIWKEVINMLPYQILAFTVHGKIYKAIPKQI